MRNVLRLRFKCAESLWDLVDGAREATSYVEGGTIFSRRNERRPVSHPTRSIRPVHEFLLLALKLYLIICQDRI